ncbi:MAG: LPP20 family lipoprotein [Nitrospirota bacterium]
MKMEWLAAQRPAFSLIMMATGPAVLGGWLFLAESRAADPSQASPPVRQHAETSFDRLQQQERQASWPQVGGPSGPSPDPAAERHASQVQSQYSSDQFLIGLGQGDLSKGRLVCQRVSELAARADLAKQIRVLVKEHAVDRVRERTGREAEQDIEVTREEIVREYLQGVKIVDRQIDEAGGTCTATAVMLKSRIAPQSAPDAPELTPAVVR